VYIFVVRENKKQRIFIKMLLGHSLLQDSNYCHAVQTVDDTWPLSFEEQCTRATGDATGVRSLVRWLFWERRWDAAFQIKWGHSDRFRDLAGLGNYGNATIEALPPLPRAQEIWGPPSFPYWRRETRTNMLLTSYLLYQ
jgi:hypothetical protein